MNQAIKRDQIEVVELLMRFWMFYHLFLIRQNIKMGMRAILAIILMLQMAIFVLFLAF